MIPTAILTPAGLEATPYQAESLAEAAPHEPEGVYTITRTYQRDKALLLDAHLDRLEESARLENIPLTLDRPALRAALRTLIQGTDNPDSRFRITAPRHDPSRLYLALEALKPVPDKLRQEGVQCATSPAKRHNPSAKTTAWMSQRQAATANLGSEIYEALLTDDEGYILEGTSSNFYAIREGKLYTANAGILNGISRRALLEVVEEVLPVVLNPVGGGEIPRLQEAFLTSSSRGVLAIVAIDGQTIGDGQPGHFTRQLSERYDAWTDAHLEPI